MHFTLNFVRDMGIDILISRGRDFMLWTGVGSFGLLLVVLLYATAGNKTPEFFSFVLSLL